MPIVGPDWSSSWGSAGETENALNVKASATIVNDFLMSVFLRLELARRSVRDFTPARSNPSASHLRLSSRACGLSAQTNVCSRGRVDLGQ
jgi:hypothetical protein